MLPIFQKWDGQHGGPKVLDAWIDKAEPEHRPARPVVTEQAEEVEADAEAVIAPRG